jgi:ribulose-5-phosphate 4-epimerase/fuculose-1-phosphate aldolase
MDHRAIKTKLAQAYQILAHLQLDDHTYTHLSARADTNSYYIYPFGLRFTEVTPDNLLQVAFDGTILHGSEFQYNRTGYIIHGNIYQARGDINAVFHLHTPEIVAVSACKAGLMPISQWALHFYNQMSYHAYNSLALDNTQGAQLTTDLANNLNMLLQNHGSISCGKTIEEATFYCYHLQQACKTQCLALAMGQELVIPNEPTCLQAVNDLLTFEKNLGQRDWLAWLKLLSTLKNSQVNERIAAQIDYL